jgi:hypothetical protein
VTVDVKDNQRAVIEVLVLEGCAGEQFVIRLRNVDEGSAGRPHRYERDTVIRSVLQEDLAIGKSRLIARKIPIQKGKMPIASSWIEP